jgi:hypothetical protein
MALLQRIVFIFEILIKYSISKKINLNLFILYSGGAFIMQILKFDDFYKYTFMALSYYSLYNLYNEDKVISNDNFYSVLGIGKLEIHSAKIIILFILMLVQGLILNLSQLDYFYNVLAPSLLIAVILNFNAYDLNSSWIRILIFFISYLLIRLGIAQFGNLIGLFILLISCLLSFYNFRYEYSRFI